MYQFESDRQHQSLTHMAKPIELLLDHRGKMSRTGLMFLVWMVFIMTLIGYVTFKTDKIAEISEPYVYITLVLCGTYTARRFLDNKTGVNTQQPVVTPPVVAPPTTPTTPTVPGQEVTIP